MSDQIMEKIFGIGWAKTGTKTLGECFKLLGFKHQSRRLDLVEKLYKNDLKRIIGIANKSQTFEDWPWIILYKELNEYYPTSKYILTIRDEENWIRSYRNLLQNEGKPTMRKNRIRSYLYGFPFPDVTDSQLINRYLKHNDDVIEYFRSNKDKLLVVDWEKGHGWKELCEFLNIEVPEKVFPHANRGKYN